VCVCVRVVCVCVRARAQTLNHDSTQASTFFFLFTGKAFGAEMCFGWSLCV